MFIEKKVNKDAFELILKGIKKYEIRLNEFECEEGDKLLLKEKDPQTGQLTGRQIEKTVTRVSKIDINNYHWPKKEIEDKGLLVISFN